MQDTQTKPLCSVAASAPRRWMGIGVLALLGGMLVYIAFVAPPDQMGWQVFLIVLGLTALALAEKMRRATELEIHLTAEGVFDSTGERIAALDNIRAVDRGSFAFKPSNGFMLRLETPAPRRWQPGIWWRMGRRVGIGGVMPGAQTKIMAEMLQAMLQERG